jgi:hypothetical protein
MPHLQSLIFCILGALSVKCYRNPYSSLQTTVYEGRIAYNLPIMFSFYALRKRIEVIRRIYTMSAK